MFTFSTCGYEHSIANMGGLLLGLLLGPSETVTWNGYWYNLSLATLGNVVGGAIFVAGLYWIGSPRARALRVRPEESLNGEAPPDQALPGLVTAEAVKR